MRSSQARKQKPKKRVTNEMIWNELQKINTRIEKLEKDSHPQGILVSPEVMEAIKKLGIDPETGKKLEDVKGEEPVVLEAVDKNVPEVDNDFLKKFLKPRPPTGMPGGGSGIYCSSRDSRLIC